MYIASIPLSGAITMTNLNQACLMMAFNLTSYEVTGDVNVHAYMYMYTSRYMWIHNVQHALVLTFTKYMYVHVQYDNKV